MKQHKSHYTYTHPMLLYLWFGFDSICLLWNAQKVGKVGFYSIWLWKSKTEWDLPISMYQFHILLKCSLKDFEHYLASTWNEHIWTFFVTAFGIGMKTNLSQSCGHCWLFQICWPIECSTFLLWLIWPKNQ